MSKLPYVILAALAGSIAFTGCGPKQAELIPYTEGSSQVRGQFTRSPVDFSAAKTPGARALSDPDSAAVKIIGAEAMAFMEFETYDGYTAEWDPGAAVNPPYGAFPLYGDLGYTGVEDPAVPIFCPEPFFQPSFINADISNEPDPGTGLNSFVAATRLRYFKFILLDRSTPSVEGADPATRQDAYRSVYFIATGSDFAPDTESYASSEATMATPENDKEPFFFGTNPVTGEAIRMYDPEAKAWTGYVGQDIIDYATGGVLKKMFVRLNIYPKDAGTIDFLTARGSATFASTADLATPLAMADLDLYWRESDITMTFYFEFDPACWDEANGYFYAGSDPAEWLTMYVQIADSGAASGS